MGDTINRKQLVRRVITSVLFGLLLLTLRQYLVFTMVCAIAAWLHIWWSKLYWVAPVVAFMGVVMIAGALVFPAAVSVDWLGRGASLIMLMMIVTVLGFNNEHAKEILAS